MWQLRPPMTRIFYQTQTPRRTDMLMHRKTRFAAVLLAAVSFGWAAASASASPLQIEGTVQAGGGMAAGATVILFAASAAAPARLTQGLTDADGKFSVTADPTPGDATSYYLVASGGTPAVSKAGGNNKAIGLLAVLGSAPPANVIVSKFTTVASVWTHTQFLGGTGNEGHALGLRIAAGNVPNFVDLSTDGWGSAIQDPLNSGQTPTMANFATIADLLAGCPTRVVPDACDALFKAATSPGGDVPTDTLAAAESIARAPWHLPGELFALLNTFYPVPTGKNLRAVPFMPYLNWAPSAWVLPLKFDGGGYRAGGKAMFDSQGNVWVTNRFGSGLLGMFHLVDMGVRLKLAGVEAASDYLTKTMSQQQGGTRDSGSVTLLHPDGTQYPGSPFTGGGLPGPWAAAVDGNDNVWISNFASPSSQIVQRCGVRTETCPPGTKTGEQISPPGGYVGGGLQMQTDIGADPAGNFWAINNWQDIDSCIGTPNEALSTRCGGQGVVIFYGLAKPVRAPQIGPARSP